jgi:quinoprotein glucose dehydrogenase
LNAGPDLAVGVSWPSYGGNLAGQRFSPLTEVNRTTVGRLVPGWTWRAGEAKWPSPDSSYTAQPGWFEATPLVVNDTLYVPTALNRLYALDARTGREMWRFDPGAYRRPPAPGRQAFVHRGVAQWSDHAGRRIFLNSRWRLFAIDAASGRPIESFGQGGEVDLAVGLRWPVNRDHLAQTSPPLVWGDLVIVGSSVGDGLVHRRDPPGEVQAFDVRTGEARWRWSPIPVAGEPGSETWEAGSVEVTGHTNVWAPMSADSARGLLYLPVSTPSNDWYGGSRKGANLYAESLVCLTAATGKLVWHAQLVHHGLWDYDPPAQPVLFQTTRGDTVLDAVVITGKTGFAYAFERLSGRPLWPLIERPVPPSTVPGESASPTQPFPTQPPAFARQGFTEEDVVDFTPKVRAAALAALRGLKWGPLFTPPSLEGTVVMPGWIGGSGWGGGAFDPASGTLFVKATNRASFGRLAGPDDRAGRPRYVLDSAAANYLDIEPPRGWPARLAGWRRRPFASIPINKPPYGTLTAIDMTAGSHRWQVVVGDFPEVRRHPMLRGLNLPPLGVPGAPGPLVTAGGLVFLSGGGAVLYALDRDDGRIAWQHDLGRPAYANPMSYRTATGRQFIVIATGFGADARLEAFTLPLGTDR